MRERRTRWYQYFWIFSIVYFSLGFVNILFAWLGMICFLTPLGFALLAGNKAYCNHYCDRGQLFQLLGSRLRLSARKELPAWLRTRRFRYGFLAFFLTMFANVMVVSYHAAAGAPLQETVTLFWLFDVPWGWAYSGGGAPWAAQFAFGFYSLMLTSAIIGILMMLRYRPRAWCVICPMGTMTQMICRAKATAAADAVIPGERRMCPND
ncbi:hypothetical protein HMPREF1992_00111 [Selenomonas sp. oral taxon 892 str. F0426]|uniref:4Fe-4S binding protein n=1 Tax=Selenomonas sp. oral taxon 892 TaxID=1321785 RepID=UPI0003AD4956|nr:4Fe-4S binding protein [Selenomonas sp. oral taxon 892]ERJ95999.1 hypothetical protein HMPREF1992_00111 [Selenomonas sp. oral taxon 892 str. F0426]